MTSESVFDIAEKQKQLRELEKASLSENFWNEQDKARETLKDKNKLGMIVDNWKKLKDDIDDIEILFDLAREEGDEQTAQEIEGDLERLKASVRDAEMKLMLGSPQDAMNSIMTIHAGAGGTEAQDWAEMLLRMYLRWAERKGF
ncbi:MAG: PCRF domain-containing protein, partial [Syntrophales bacterium]